MPELSYEMWEDIRKPSFPSPKSPVFDLKFDVLPFNGQSYKGYVKCEGTVEDAFRGYAVCRIYDKNDNELFLSGWIVDLSPSQTAPAEWVKGARVKVFMGGRPDFLESPDFVVHDEEVKKKVTRAVEEAKKRGSDYSGIVIYIFPAEEFYKEQEEISQRTGRLAEVRKEVEEAFGL